MCHWPSVRGADVHAQGWSAVPIESVGGPDLAASLPAALAAADTFFALPADRKRGVLATDANGYRGWEPPSIHGHASGTQEAKEGFVIGQEPAPGRSDPQVRRANPWPADVPSLRPALRQVRDRLQAVALAVLPAVEDAMTIPRGSLSDRARDPMQALRVLRYPPTPAGQNPALGIGPHTDAGCLTLLWQADEPGLEVQAVDGTWSVVAPDPAVLILSLGDMAALLSGGRVPALRHRVINRTRRTRHSIAFFLDLDPDGLITPLRSRGSDGPAKGPTAPLTAAEMLAKMHERDYR